MLLQIIDQEINPHVDQWEAEGTFPAHKIFKTYQPKASVGQGSWELDSTINYLNHLTFKNVIQGVQQRQLRPKNQKRTLLGWIAGKGSE